MRQDAAMFFGGSARATTHARGVHQRASAPTHGRMVGTATHEKVKRVRGGDSCIAIAVTVATTSGSSFPGENDGALRAETVVAHLDSTVEWHEIHVRRRQGCPIEVYGPVERQKQHRLVLAGSTTGHVDGPRADALTEKQGGATGLGVAAVNKDLGARGGQGRGHLHDQQLGG